jgi:FkbM family methyltransferase
MRRLRSQGAGVASAMLRAVPWSLRKWVKRIPVLAGLQRRFLSSVMGTEAFVYRVDKGPARGVRFLIRWPEDKGLWTGTYEMPLATCLAEMVPEGAIAYDIGGWHGFYTGVMAARGAKEVHVFEPLPDNVERIDTLKALNPEFRIDVHPYALGDRDGSAELVVMPNTSMAKLVESEFQKEVLAPNRIQVRVAKLDTLVSAGEIPPPALIKMDVEGAELKVLNGAVNLLKRFQPIIFVEVHSPALLTKCESALKAVGYEVCNPDGTWLDTSEIQGSVIQILALPRRARTIPRGAFTTRLGLKRV